MEGSSFAPIQLPDDVWRTPAVLHALHSRDLSAIFHFARKYGISQHRIAANTGLTQGRISEIMTGKRQVTSFAMIERVANGFNMPDQARVAFGLAPLSLEESSRIFGDVPASSAGMEASNENLRAAMRETGVTIGDVARAAGVDVKTVSRWLSEGRTPYPRHRKAVAAYLGIDEVKLWPTVTIRKTVRVDHVSADPLARALGLSVGEPVDPSLADGQSGGGPDAASAPESNINDVFTLDDEERLILAARVPRRHDPGVIDALATVLAGQRHTEDLIGSKALIEPVSAQLVVVTDLVIEARGDLRKEVLNIGSQWAQFAGWLYASTGNLEDANRIYRVALEWATEADDPNMMATALNMQGHTAWLGGRVGPVIGLSEAAQRDKRTSPGVRALAAQQEARGLALSGAGIDHVDRKLDEAQELVVKAIEDPENEPPWIYFFSPDYLTLQRGLAYRLLGHYTDAIRLITAGLMAIPEDMRQSEWVASHYLFQLAATYARSGDVTSASSLAKEINSVAQKTGSMQLRGSLSRFHDQLDRKWPSHSDVLELGRALS